MQKTIFPPVVCYQVLYGQSFQTFLPHGLSYSCLFLTLPHMQSVNPASSFPFSHTGKTIQIVSLSPYPNLASLVCEHYLLLFPLSLSIVYIQTTNIFKYADLENMYLRVLKPVASEPAASNGFSAVGWYQQAGRDCVVAMFILVFGNHERKI